MRKSKRQKSRASPEQALDFLENFRKMQAGLDEPTQMISLRVPKNILRNYKTLASTQGRHYQKMMIQALREFLTKNS